MKTHIVVSRNDDRIIIMTPKQIDDVRSHSILNEDEAYCACGMIRRMIMSAEKREADIGPDAAGMKLYRVNHQKLPVEIHFDDDNGTTVLDLTKEDAQNVADMLWAAHRSNHSFYCKVSISSPVRRIERIEVKNDIIPVPDDIRSTEAQILGNLTKRALGQKVQTEKGN